MAKKSFPFDLGNYVKNADGSYSKINRVESAYIKQQRAVNEGLVLKEKVNNSPDFQAKINTEWFISGYNVPSKKNSRQNFVKNGRQISIPSKKHAEYVKMTDMQYSVFGIEFRKAVNLLGLTYPLYVEFTFVRDSKRAFDYCNACQTCEDIMKDQHDKSGNIVKLGWFPDDCADYLIPVFKPYEYNKENPGVRIKLLTNK